MRPSTAGWTPGNCTPGDVNAGGYIVQTFCPLAGVQRVRIDLGEREDRATVTLPVAATVLAGPGADRIAVDGPGHELSGGRGTTLSRAAAATTCYPATRART